MCCRPDGPSWRLSVQRALFDRYAVKLTVVYDHRFACTPDGRRWSKGNLGYSFLSRYLRVFDGLDVVCRQQDVDSPPTGFVEASGPGCEFLPLGNFRGMLGYVRHRRDFRAQLEERVEEAIGTSAFLLRAPAVIGKPATDLLRRRGVPYAVEVVGDPSGVFGWGRPAGPVGVVLARTLSTRLRQQVRDAVAVGYVPSPELRERYPARPGAATEDYSSLALAEDAIVPAPRRTTAVPAPLRLVTVCSLDFPYKGVDVLVQAVEVLRRRGVDVSATVVGDGRLRQRYERDVVARGLGQVVAFVGQVSPGAEIRRHLDAADVFVLASLTEGLPRAMVEAMARGLPCVGTTAGGMPALLPAEYCARPGDAADLARAIMAATRTVEALGEASSVNLRRAGSFRATETHRRSDRIYRALQEATANAVATSRRR